MLSQHFEWPWEPFYVHFSIQCIDVDRAVHSFARRRREMLLTRGEKATMGILSKCCWWTSPPFVSTSFPLTCNQSLMWPLIEQKIQYIMNICQKNIQHIWMFLTDMFLQPKGPYSLQSGGRWSFPSGKRVFTRSWLVPHYNNTNNPLSIIS